MSSGRFLRNLATMGTGILAGRVLSFLQGVILARMLGATDLGKYATIISICTIISRVFDFGLPHAFSFYLRKFRNSLGSLLRILLLNALVSCFLAPVAVFGMRYLPIPIIQEISRQYNWVALICAYLIVSTVVSILPNFLMASGEYARFVSFFNAGIAVQIAFQYLMYFFMGPSIKAFFVANLAGMAVMTAALFSYLIFSIRGQNTVARVSVRECYGFGLRTQWGVLMKLCSRQADLPLVSSIVSPGDVGQYSLANTFREAAMIPQTMYAGIFQNMLMDKANKTETLQADPLLMGIYFQLGLSLVIAILSWVLLPFLIPVVYGSSFAAASPIVVLLVFSTVFTGPSGLCWLGFNSIGRPQLMSIVSTVSGLLSPVLVLTLTSAYGIAGAGWAAIIVSLITFAITMAMTIKLNGYRIRDFKKAFKDSRGIIPRVLSRK